MIGKVDPDTEKIYGKDVIYVFPDLYNAIYGRFEDGLLISGEMCTIKEAFVNPETFIMSLTGIIIKPYSYILKLINIASRYLLSILVLEYKEVRCPKINTWARNFENSERSKISEFCSKNDTWYIYFI